MAVATLNIRTHRPGQVAQMAGNSLRMFLNGSAADGLRSVETHMAEIVALIDAYEAQAEAFRGNGVYTRDGQQQQLDALQKATQVKLAAMTEPPLRGFEQHLDQLRRAYREPDPHQSDSERLRQEIRASEIRQHARALSHADLIMFYRHGSSVEQQKALEGSPVAMLDPQIQADVQAERLQRALPELHQEITELSALAESYSEVVNAAEQHVGVVPERSFTYGPNSAPRE